MKRFLGWFFAIVLVLALAFCARTYLFGFSRVAGTSMQPSMNPNDLVFVTKYSYWFDGPDRGDVVLCYLPDRASTYFKRVVAIPGDTFSIKDGVSYLNGEVYEEDYAVGEEFCEDFSVTLETDQYLVLGDNRPESYDSRAEDVGMLSRKDFIGRARLVVWPFGRFRGFR